MKILYIAPEHVSGGFSLFAEGHRKRGNECRWITFFKSQFGYEEDLCFELWGMPAKSWVKGIRSFINRTHSLDDIPELSGNPPVWLSCSAMEAILYRLRDQLNSPRIKRTIKRHHLNDFDIYHFEQGIDPYRYGRWVKQLKKLDKGIVAFYHGSDLRSRGVIPAVHSASVLNLTSEIDLLDRLPGMKYLYLPIDMTKLPVGKRSAEGDKLQISHAARNRKLKGSDLIEQIVLELAKEYSIEWVMIENVDYNTSLRIKADSDIFIDQITDSGGWGYGASSVEALAMGIPTMTMINPRVAEFLGEHPFVNVTPDSLRSELIDLIENVEHRRQLTEYGLKWVNERHGIDSVMDKLYSYYREAGLM